MEAEGLCYHTEKTNEPNLPEEPMPQISDPSSTVSAKPPCSIHPSWSGRYVSEEAILDVPVPMVK